ncbi:hypothetical protein LOK49_LG09G00145 [Camellia lanceoleosa]|uniref:Uncharacterized protein n=1 Tax=Camellia lanceoleosa TaxID=1840588 RepID=A0ACC0GKP5_9ERIC|nr:hypothetical protein LOK49_LG09G00145 [Camellia lanceoleosa]
MAARFKRVAEAFDEVARARLCESSGSEYSPPETAVDLSDLVKSFMERESGGGERENEEGDGENGFERESYCCDSELKESLIGLLGCDDDNELKRNIGVEIEEAYRVVGNGSSPEFKRRLMKRLRERGFDAGLCKSKWEKVGRFPSGSYEYIDIKLAETRYIIEFCLAREFEIARATESYTSLLELFPPIFVGKVEELKQVVRLMCNAVKDSMKSMNMPVPPWRRHGYVQAKWFGSYRRTINEVPIKKGSDTDVGSAKKRSVGFLALPAISHHCREGFGSRVGIKVGQLAMALNGTTNMLL